MNPISKPRTSISKIPTPSQSSSQSRLLGTVQHDLTPIDFQNDKEVQQKVEEIINEFRQKDKEWTFRHKALITLQRIVTGNAIEMKQWTVILRSLTLPLIEQLQELRSTIAKEACQVVTLLVQRMKNRFEPFAVQYLHILIKLVVVKVTIIADAAFQTIKEILENLQTKGLFQLFLDASMDQHNEQLRKKAGDCILIIINRAIEEEGMILTSAVPGLEKSIEKLLTDGGVDIRQTARYIYWAYAELNEKAATTMFYQFSTTTQRNLFSVEEKLPDGQKEIVNKIRQAIIEEEENQRKVEESADLDLDISDFRRGDNTSSHSALDSNRAKTPTSQTGRQSGLKSRVPVNITTTSSGSNIKRSGSSLGMKSTPSSPSLEERTIKKPIDPMLRSKSSLGTTRRLSEIPSSSSGSTTTTTTSTSTATTPTSILKSKTTSSSPNISLMNQTGRYSSIGTRGTTNSTTGGGPPSLLTKSSSISSLTRSLPPQSTSKPSLSSTLTSSTSLSSTLTRSTPPPGAKSSSTSTTPTTSAPKSTTTIPISPSSSLLKKPSTGLTSSMLKKPTTNAPITKPQQPATLTKSKSSTSVKPTTTTTTSTKSTTTTTSTTKPKTTSTTPTDNSDIINDFKNRKENISKISEGGDIDINSIEESLNYSKDAFNEISDELAGSIRDAKNNLDDFVQSDLTLDDFNDTTTSTTSGGNKSKRHSMKRTNSNDDFNWVDDSVDQDLIENESLDFNDYSHGSNSNSNQSSQNNSKRNSLNFTLEDDDLNQDSNINNNNNNSNSNNNISDLTVNELENENEEDYDVDEMY
ncbi:hypothetical protein DLAC_02503 [Tieghemostelium lacteum]|uniref:TOG domain-containing protein n=1 Tax=Tieghemostelium lacteum TaxID=361077 RepID=A0A152A2N5_TIELA|nr:hypothetical protein DLAC_02503 [Tieghemostelium lacteum]|eukprot:KYR00498.1 hypothetical protein DLAC_02503 [Tieghemostelium lacteum]